VSRTGRLVGAAVVVALLAAGAVGVVAYRRAHTPLRTFPTDYHWNYGVHFSTDGPWLLLRREKPDPRRAVDGELVEVWSLETGALRRVFGRKPLGFSPRTGRPFFDVNETEDGGIPPELVDPTTGTKRPLFPNADVLCLAVSNDESLVAAITSDGVLGVHAAGSGARLTTLGSTGSGYRYEYENSSSAAAQYAFMFSPRGDLLAGRRFTRGATVGGVTELVASVAVWSVATGKLLDDAPGSVPFGFTSRGEVVIDRETGTSPSATRQTGATPSATRQTGATPSAARRHVRFDFVARAQDGKERVVAAGASSNVCALSASGERLAFLANEALRVISTETGALVRSVPWHDIHLFAISPDGDRLAVTGSGEKGMVTIWELPPS
jgi:hypothetical protein